MRLIQVTSLFLALSLSVAQAQDKTQQLVEIGLDRLADNQAAQQSVDGQLEQIEAMEKAYLHFDMAQWVEARQALMASLDKGLEQRQTGEAWLLLGMTRFQLQQYNRATEACEKATQFEKSRRHAEQWIAYIAREKEKRDSMMSTGS